MKADSYHNRPEWSYSQMKLILDHGIDYAVAAKQKMIPAPCSKSIDLGQLAHMLLLGGEDCYVLKEDSGYANYLSKAAKAWRNEQLAKGKTIIDQQEWEAVDQMLRHAENHPHTPKYVQGEHVNHEIEMYAKVDGVSLRGKADALINTDSALVLTDVKTTYDFDSFFRKASYRHYDLQAAVYTLVSSVSQGVSSCYVNYYFCVIETVVPYRVQYFHCSPEFLEAGERKLKHCLEEIKKFGDREPSFLLTEIPELGDFSL